MDEKKSDKASLVSGEDYIRPPTIDQLQDALAAGGAGGPAPPAKKQKVAHAILDDGSSDNEEHEVQYKRYVQDPHVNQDIFVAEMALYEEYGYDEELEKLLFEYTTRVLKCVMPRMR